MSDEIDGLKCLCEEYACPCHFEMKTMKPKVESLELQVDALRLHLQAIEEEGCEVQETPEGRGRVRCVVRVQEGIMAQKHCCRSCMAYFALHDTNDSSKEGDACKCWPQSRHCPVHSR